MAEEPATEGGAEAAPPKKKMSMDMLLAIVNSVLVLSALGMAVYTKILFKKPQISESTELKRMEAEMAQPPAPVEKTLVNFEQLTVNIAPTSGKAHFASITMTIECRDPNAASAVKKLTDKIKDKLILALGKRELSELNTIQGKLLLKTEVMRDFNQILRENAHISAGILDIYFSDFALQ